MKVYGIKVYINSIPLKKTLLIYGILDDTIIEFLYNKFITIKINDIRNNIPNEIDFQNFTIDEFKLFVKSSGLL